MKSVGKKRFWMGIIRPWRRGGGALKDRERASDHNEAGGRATVTDQQSLGSQQGEVVQQ